jgi:heme exporter protein B
LSVLQPIAAVLGRDLQIAFRRWGDVGTPLIFFVIVATLFPLALSPKREILQGIGPGVLWIGALLSNLLSLNALYRADVEDGSMEQLMVGPYSLTAIMFGKTLAHWLVSGLPLVLLAPVLAVTYHLPAEGVWTLAVTLLIGTPTLSLLGSVGAALTAGVRQSGGLLALIVIPLMLPVLMFGARATALAGSGETVSGPLYLLGALLALALTLLPFATAAAIRISID